jgi:hypothetical protein
MEFEPQSADAQAILMGMADFLSKTPRFSVTLADRYDVLQDNGQMIEFGETRQILVSRPDHLRVEVENSDGDRHLVFYDGKAITVFSPGPNLYAQAAKAGGIDAAVKFFLQDLRMRLPLAALLLSRLPQELQSRTQSLDYVERTQLDGKPVHHLAGRTETVDYQVWVAAGAEPLPLRIVLTYRNAKGHPQFRAQFSDWNLSPQVTDAQFAFNPPAGARKIAFAAELPHIEVPGANNPAQAGGKP